jgi:hypothetical protein
MTGKAIRRAWRPLLPLAVVAAVLAFSASAAQAQSPTAEPQPVLVYQNIHDGDVILQTAFGIQLCFASPVNIRDLDKGGDFSFRVTEPDGLGLGNRDVFQPNGYGITVYPGHPIGDTAGQWKFHYRLTSPDAQSALEGDITYTVDPNGSPIPQATPPVCVASGGTATASPTPDPNATTPAAASASPVLTSRSPSASATPTGGPIAAGSSSSPDILKYALFTIGAAGAAAVVLLLGYLVRRRVGYDPHREKPGGDDDEHH